MILSFWPPFLASSAAAFIIILGILTIKRHVNWGRDNTAYFICFASGVLISASLLHIVPKSLSMSLDANVYLLGGFFTLFVLSRLIDSLTDKQGNVASSALSFGMIPLVGICVHSFIDGIIYSVTFSAGHFTGVLAAIGMILHEFPEGIITYLFLLKGGFEEKSAFIGAALAAGLSTPLGMILSYPFISAINIPVLGIMLSFSAGMLLYVGATHLLPEAQGNRKPYSLLALISGIAVAVLIILVEPH